MTKTPREKTTEMRKADQNVGLSESLTYPTTRGMVAMLQGLRVMPIIPQAYRAAYAAAPSPWNTP